MTSKELIEAAITVSHSASDYFIRYADEDHDDSDSHDWWKKTMTVCQHIFATVRDDDDDPVTASWFSLLLGSIDRFEFGSTYCVEMNEVDQWEVWLYDHCIREIKTRGQFRQLCRGLGIELKEDDQ